MDLVKLRNRIRSKAIKVGLTYTEIEQLADINEVLEQTMPSLMWLYEGENNDYKDSPMSEVTLSLYFITNLHDEHERETGLYQRDYIITERDKLRQYYLDWLKLISIDTDDTHISIVRDNQIPIAERISIEGFLTFEMRVTINMLREFCLDVEID